MALLSTNRPRLILAVALCALACPVALAQGAAYRVYPAPVESPLHTEPAPPADARVLVVDPADPAASPFGWHDTDGAPGADATATEGNNAAVFFDANANGVPDPGELPDGGAALTFDFPVDFAAPPVSYAEAIATNLFYWANYVHDVLHHYGFDETSGNFQATNYGAGGLGGDALAVRIVEDGGLFGTSMMTPPDGAGPRLTVRLPASGPPAYEAFDNGRIIHELAHGLTTRLTGTPANSGCLNNLEQMGEGWSDWYALMLTQRPEDTRTDPRGSATLPAPYSTDFEVNGYTHGDIAEVSVPHGVGFVWATILWEMTWDLVDAYGFDPDLYDADGGAGNQVALRLVTEALKLQPCGPGFVDGRDAILQADQGLFGGSYAEVLWGAFARRGLGFSAGQGSAHSVTDNTEAFDLPPELAAALGTPVASLALDPVAPNPAANEARVGYRLAAPGPVRLTAYDVRGREVAVLTEGARAAGPHAARLDVRGLTPGVYVLRLEASGEAQARRFVVARLD